MSMRIFARSTFLLFFFCRIELSWAQLPTGFSYSNIGSGWVQPVGTTFNSTGTKLFVWEKAGKVYVCNWNGITYIKQATPVLDISPEVGNWRDHGLLGFALDPNFDVNGLIYCLYVVDRHYLMNFGTGSYNAATNNYNSATIGRLTRYATANSGGNLTATLATRTILLGETKKTGVPVLYESHGIGALAFAADGTLLITTGEGSSYDTTDDGSVAHTYYIQALADTIILPNENVGSFRSQMLTSLSGKILRVDPTNGNGVASNPFYSAGSPRSARSRVWTLGLRNPFRMTIRPNTGSTNPATADVGEIYVTDVGWYEYEELNVIKEPASNCGWPYYDGFGVQTEFAGLNSNLNQDEPNPLYGISGCTQQYFTFRNLLKQATADNIHTVYNPCNASVPISGGNDNRFFHHLPVFDWVHGFDSTRVAVFTTNNFSIKQVGTIASGVTGIPFSGTAAVAGCWYTGTKFPPQYTDTYFLSDYGAGWIKNITIQYTDQLQKVADFASAFGAIIHMSQDPLDSSLFATDYTNESIKRITYGGNQAPIVKMSSDKTYGPGPLSVNFTGSNSYDPDGPSVTYSWNFGDASALNTSANPSHTFTPGNSLPKKYVVKLTVKDNLNVTTIDSMIVSANNTPPNVAITSPVNNSFYQLGSDTAYSLKATVTDAEHHSNELSYAWQAILRHNTHQHPEPIDTNKITSELISRIGCNGETFYWFIKLTVTDAAGLSKIDSAKLLPQCGGPLPLSLISFSVSSHNGSNNVTWTTSNEVNLKFFEIERSYDGANFIKIGTVNANTIQGVNNYNYKDDNFLDGYIYYRLKMIDIDGNFSRSFIVRVYSGTNSSNELTISPNPFHNEFLVGASFAQTGKITLRIVDVTGKVIRTIKKQVNAGFNSFQINKLENLSKGIYFLEVIQDNDTRKAKLIKEN